MLRDFRKRRQRDGDIGLDVHPQPEEIRRRDADDGEWDPFHGYAAADCTRVGRKRTPPERMAEHGDHRRLGGRLVDIRATRMSCHMVVLAHPTSVAIVECPTHDRSLGRHARE